MNETSVGLCPGCWRIRPKSCLQAKTTLNQLSYLSGDRPFDGSQLSIGDINNMISSLRSIRPDCKNAGDIDDAIEKLENIKSSL